MQTVPLSKTIKYIDRLNCASPPLFTSHCDLKVSRSQAKIDENFANYFLKTKANKKCFKWLKCTCTGLQKSFSELER